MIRLELTYCDTFQADNINEGIGMVQAVEKSVDALVEGDKNSKAYRIISDALDWSTEPKLHLIETMNSIKDREVTVQIESCTNPVKIEKSQDPSRQNQLEKRTNTFLNLEKIDETDS